jgi:hypothetical protein
MDRRIVFETLESLRRCVQRIESKRPDALAARMGLGWLAPR